MKQDIHMEGIQSVTGAIRCGPAFLWSCERTQPASRLVQILGLLH